MGMDFRENGEVVYFDAKNVGPSPYADELGRIPLMDVNFYFGHNTVTASGKGLEVGSQSVHKKLQPTRHGGWIKRLECSGGGRRPSLL